MIKRKRSESKAEETEEQIKIANILQRKGHPRNPRERKTIMKD